VAGEPRRGAGRNCPVEGQVVIAILLRACFSKSSVSSLLASLACVNECERTRSMFQSGLLTRTFTGFDSFVWAGCDVHGRTKFRRGTHHFPRMPPRNMNDSQDNAMSLFHKTQDGQLAAVLDECDYEAMGCFGARDDSTDSERVFFHIPPPHTHIFPTLQERSPI
jgi:hypothetical protein